MAHRDGGICHIGGDGPQKRDRDVREVFREALAVLENAVALLVDNLPSLLQRMLVCVLSGLVGIGTDEVMLFDAFGEALADNARSVVLAGLFLGCRSNLETLVINRLLEDVFLAPGTHELAEYGSNAHGA